MSKRRVRCSIEPIGSGGSLPFGITEENVIRVLSRHAARFQDARYDWQWYATGVCPGDHGFITVAYLCAQDELVAVGAFPATPQQIEEYQRLRKEGSLCIPASNMDAH